jgi:hypothetical protein
LIEFVVHWKIRLVDGSGVVRYAFNEEIGESMSVTLKEIVKLVSSSMDTLFGSVAKNGTIIGGSFTGKTLIVIV